MLKLIKLRFRAVIILIRFISVFISFCNILNAQSEYSLDRALVLESKGDSLLSLGLYDLAADHFKIAMQGSALLDIDKWYSLFGKFRKSRFSGKNPHVLIEEIHELLEKIDQNDFVTKGKIHFYIGYYNAHLGYINDAIFGYKKAISILSNEIEDKFNRNRFLLYSYENISLNYSRLGDQNSAIKYIKLGIELSLKMDGNPKICSLYLKYSKYLFYNGNYRKVKNVLNDSYDICSTNSELSYIYDSFAEVYLIQDSLTLAKSYFEKSIKIEPNKGYLFHQIYAIYFEKMNDKFQALVQYKKALKLLEKTDYQRSYLKNLILYANLLYESNEKEEAVSSAHYALKLYYPNLDSLDYTAWSIVDNKIPDIWIIEALLIKAKYFREEYLESNDSFALGEATYYYDLLLSHFDKLKSEYYSSSSQYRMGTYSQKIYSEIITFYIDQFNINNDMDDLQSAFSLAQRANSFVLRNAVSDRKALELVGVEQDSLEEYLYLASKAASDSSEDSTNSAEVLMEFDAYKESLLSNYPSYGKYDGEEEISLSEVQKILSPNTLVVKYYYFDEVLTVIGISKDKVFAENIPFPKELDSIINSNLNISSQNEANDSLEAIYLANSKRIYDLVLGDLLSKYNMQTKDHFTIIPDGPLKKVSFNALAVDNSGDWDDPNSYLISRHAINYLYYCSQLRNDNDFKLKDGFIGFGIQYEEEFLKEIVTDYLSNFDQNTDKSKVISLRPLKYANDEVLSVAEILNGTSVINGDVTPAQVFSTINNFDVIHFSAHAIVDEEEYLNSFVVLNKGNGQNYKLKYSDILNLDLDSELVVLSACQTSSGKSVTGEGLMSLSRAFVQSGSDATVGAYWNAPDYATKELMTLFYSNLKEGMTKSKAMQHAQMKYLTNDNISSPTIRSPFFWASWAVYGNDQPLKMGESLFDVGSWEFYALLAGITLIVLLLVKYLSKSKNH